MQTPEKTRTAADDREEWEQLTLLPFTERRPEARETFRTLGGTRARADLHAGARRRSSTTRATSAFPGSSRTRAGRTRRCIARSRGRCGRSPASAPPTTPTRRFRYLIAQGQTGISTDFDMPTLMGYDSRRRAQRRRSRPRGRRDRQRRRHARSLRRDRSREDQRLDDDQPVGVDPARDVSRRRRRARLRPQASSRERFRTTSSKSTSRRRSGSTRRARRCASCATRSSTPRSICRATTRSTSAATTRAKRAAPRSRRSRSRSRPASRTSRRS